KYKISIIDIMGRKVLEQSGIATSGTNNINLSIRNQKQSIYLVLINTTTEKSSKKFIYNVQ
ncbi:MAG: T9SS type A sorting domain-containing protein, partial [Bacteroidales bacterium]|nr:T9SS type A sorting domain-containing protein [Bacteroidales bacterium]